MYAAALDEGELANIDDIAETFHISANHLTKSVHRLGKLGYIRTVRGRRGGFRLAKQPSEIRIGEVVRQTEENWNLLECFDAGDAYCILNPMCNLKRVLGEALKAYLAVLDAYTLEDIAGNRSLMRRLLRVGDPRLST